MPDDPDATQLQVPTLPESANSTGQQVATASPPPGIVLEGQLLTAPSDYSHIADSIRGLASGRENLSFGPTSLAMLLVAVDVAGQHHRSTVKELAELRAELKALQKAHADLRVEHATTCADLRSERSNSTLRTLTSNIGSGLIGLIPFAADKANALGGIVCALVGGLLLAAAWIIPLLSRPGRGDRQ